MLKNNKKLFALILSLVMIASCLPINIFAVGASNSSTYNYNGNTAGSYSSDVIVEEESLREENVKHFKMPDGSYTAVVYDSPVHRKDSNGVWQDIDNRMNESTVKNKQAYVTADGRAVFSKKINSDDSTVFELSENGYSIKVSFADSNIKNTTAQLSNHATKYVPTGKDNVETQYKKLKTIDNSTTISYKNLLKGMTLEYVLSANDVKENIIIEKADVEYVYSFTYELVGLVALLNEDGSINLLDENTQEPVCLMPAPYMYDADGDVSYDVSYDLEDLGNGVYSLTVSANNEWINDAERAFPVVIDPTIAFEASYRDTYINSSDPDVNYGHSNELWISSTRTTFMKYYSLPSIPDDATINRATLNLNYYYRVTSGSLDIGLYLVYVDWAEYSLTWNSANQNMWLGILPSQLGTATLAASSSITEDTPGLASINVTELVQAWYAGMANYGIALKYKEGSNKSVIIKSWEAGSSTRAKYEISYSTGGLPLSNGTYFFNNAEFDKYMQIDNNASTSEDGAILELWDFDGTSDQKWTLEYLHNGYYKITSYASGKAITAPSEKDDSLTQKDYSVSSDQMWKITSAGNGMHKLKPKSNTSYYMAAGDGIFTSDGRNVEIRSSQSDNKDEWYLTKIQYEANVFNYYDMGYPIRYGESTSVASNKIDSYIDSVALQYLRLFGLELTTNTATYYQSPIDICKGTVNSSNIDAMCSHGGVNHSERSNVISDFNASHVGDSKTTYVLWSCHKIASTATNGDTDYNRSCSHGTGIFLIEISSTNRKRNSQGVLMHELNHQYGAKDHYHELADKNDPNSCKFKERCSECGDDPRPSSCIMYQSRIDITNDDVICAECQSDILTHLENHHSN